MKKLINWLIHKLGGYTEEEYTEVVDHAEEPWFELAKEYHDKCIKLERKYEAEHENYLAMLNLYNTTVEQKQNNAMGVAGAIDTIKACKVAMCPCYWGNE